MPTISIHIRLQGQKIPRPLCRASSESELRELVWHYTTELELKNIDTDEPIGAAVRDGRKIQLFAFRER